MDKAQKQIVRTVSGLALGVACGWLMYHFLDEQTVTSVNEEALVPVRDLLLNVLKMMMAPVTFFAILAGVTNVQDTGMLAKMGGKLVTVSLFMQVLIVFLTLLLAAAIFSGDLTYMQKGIVTSQQPEVNAEYPSLQELFFHIAPDNVVTPFTDGHILQVIFMAVFFGIILNKTGAPRKVIEGISFAFKFSIDVLKVIVLAIPVMVFLSMATLISHTGMEALWEFSGLFAGLFLGVLIVWLIGALTTMLFCRMSPWKLTRKLVSISPFVFSVSSSHARLPFVLQFCAEKLGIDSKLAIFSIPIGVQLNKAGNCVYFSLKLEESGKELAYRLPENHDRAQHCSQMDCHREIQETFPIDSQQLLDDHQVTAGADRQELGEPLYYSQKESLQPIHLTSCYPPSQRDAS